MTWFGLALVHLGESIFGEDCFHKLTTHNFTIGINLANEMAKCLVPGLAPQFTLLKL